MHGLFFASQAEGDCSVPVPAVPVAWEAWGSLSLSLSLCLCRGRGGENSQTLELLFQLRSSVVADCRAIEHGIIRAATRTSAPGEAPAAQHASLWDSLTTVPRSADYGEYLRHIALSRGRAPPRRLEFTHALASALRYVAGPVFFSSAAQQGTTSSSSSSELSSELLDGTDILNTLVHAMSTWVNLHIGSGEDKEGCEVCTTCLRLLLPPSPSWSTRQWSPSCCACALCLTSWW